MSTNDPSGPPVRWGILGTGTIARQFAADLGHAPDARLLAVGSRSPAGAAAFGDALDVPRRYPSYAALVADPDVDVVYVATPHPLHHEHALLAIEAGKAVLCEKPFAVNATQTRAVIATAQRRGTFLMEAMWTRFLPQLVWARELLASGALGEVIAVLADFGARMDRDPASRVFAPQLGGGALLDLGIYPVSLASMVLGTPARVTAVSAPAFSGVDGQTSMLFEYAGGAHAVLTCSIEAVTPTRAAIVGTHARIEVGSPWFSPAPVRLVTSSGEVTLHDEHVPGHGMQLEAAEVGRCLRAGLLESPVLPLAETVSIMETMDQVRAQIGLTYPGE